MKKQLLNILAIIAVFTLSVQSPLIAATYQTPDVRALFETSLASKITSTATSFTLTSATDHDGNALASSTYGFIIDEGTATEEIILADCTGTTCTNATRGLSVLTGTTTIANSRFEHRRGASVKMTDAPILLFLTNVFKGRQNIENLLSYTSAFTVATSSNQIPHASWVAGIANQASTTVDARLTALDALTVHLAGTETITGNKSFTGVTTLASTTLTSTKIPIFDSNPTISDDKHVATKKYVDDIAFSGVGDANDTSKGIVEMATGVEAASSTSTGGTGARLVLGANIATSTHNSAVSGHRVVVTDTAGKIDSNFIATSTLFTAANINGTAIGNIGKNIQVFTASSTFSVPAGVTKARVQVVGGGSDGGSCTGPDVSGAGRTGNSGAAGGYALEYVDLSATSSVAVTVGLKGQTSSFGSFLSATGGSGQTPGVGSGGDLNLSGQAGASGNSGDGATNGDAGGTSFFGGGGAGGNRAAGSDSGNYGGGGGAAGCGRNESFSGGQGAPGVVVVEW